MPWSPAQGPPHLSHTPATRLGMSLARPASMDGRDSFKDHTSSPWRTCFTTYVNARPAARQQRRLPSSIRHNATDTRMVWFGASAPLRSKALCLDTTISIWQEPTSVRDTQLLVQMRRDEAQQQQLYPSICFFQGKLCLRPAQRSGHEKSKHKEVAAYRDQPFILLHLVIGANHKVWRTLELLQELLVFKA